MRPGQFGGDRETDTAARGLRCPLATEEPVEDARQFLGGNADAGVGDFEHGIGAGRPGDDRDLPAGRGELQRVGEQVGDHLMQPARVGQDLDAGQPPAQRHVSGLEPAGQAVGRGGGDAGQIAGTAVQPQGGRVGRRHRLQVVHHARQPEYLVPQRGQLGRRRLGNPVEQGLVARLEHRDGRAQLMGDTRDQVTADLILTVQRVRHLIEGGGQFTQLPLSPDVAGP
jgi:hypothetical protein